MVGCDFSVVIVGSGAVELSKVVAHDWWGSVREKVKVARKAVEKTEKALQSEGQIIGEVLGQLDSECCE